MKKISLTQGKVALVDDVDHDWLKRWCWCATQDRHTFYAVHGIKSKKGKQGIEKMHRLILGLKIGDKKECDHIDGNGLNNQRANLRVCTPMQNRQNQRNLRIGTSGHKGVCWDHYACKWRSQITVNKKQIYLGLFNLETDAAQAYDAAALKYYREFALTNEMMGLLQEEI